MKTLRDILDQIIRNAHRSIDIANMASPAPWRDDGYRIYVPSPQNEDGDAPVYDGEIEWAEYKNGPQDGYFTRQAGLNGQFCAYSREAVPMLANSSLQTAKALELLYSEVVQHIHERYSDGPAELADQDPLMKALLLVDDIMGVKK